MKRVEKIGRHSVTYTYSETNLSQKEMLGYIIDILNDDDVLANGLILIAPFDNEKDWAGIVTELPTVPDKDVFVETYGESALSGVTSIFAYHGQQLMLSYRPGTNTFSIILPREFKDTIDDIEHNVIQEAIDGVPVIVRDEKKN